MDRQNRRQKPAARWRPWDRRGFTLMEIMLAMAVLGIVLATLYNAWAAVTGTGRRVSAESLRYEAAKVCLDRMAADLRGLFVTQRPEYTVPDIDDPPDPYRFEAPRASAASPPFPALRFAAFSHLPLGGDDAGGVARIAYYLDTDAPGPPYPLRRSDRPLPAEPLAPEAEDPILCEAVRHLAFGFIDADGDVHEAWNSDEADFGYGTPQALVIHLEIGKGETPMVIETTVELPVGRKADDSR